MQSTEAACGFCATANALKALGFDSVDEATVARWVNKVRRAEHPGVQGLGEMNLVRALTEAAPKRLRLTARAMLVHDGPTALAALRGHLEAGAVAVLGVDPDEQDGAMAMSHWVAAVGRVGERFLIADSAETELVVSRSPRQLTTRWELPGTPSTFYAVVVEADR
jgi:hypothetical protein